MPCGRFCAQRPWAEGEGVGNTMNPGTTDPGTTSSPGRRRWMWPVVLVVLAVVAVAGGAVVARSLSSKSGPAAASSPTVPAMPNISAVGDDPASVELPKVTDASAAKVWLDGEGHVSVVFVTTVPKVWSAPTCAEAAAAFDAVGSPKAVLTAASSTPDNGTAEMLTTLYSLTGPALQACTASGLPPAEVPPSADGTSPAATLAWQWMLVNRQLDALGVAH